MSTGGWMNLGRDQSVNSTMSLRGDLTTQFDENNQIKAGFQFTYDDLDINSGTYSPSMSTWTRSMIYHVYPYRIGAFVQDKLEFQGFIANLGVRFDYSNPNGEYYSLSTYDALYGQGLGKSLELNAPKERQNRRSMSAPESGYPIPSPKIQTLFQLRSLCVRAVLLDAFPSATGIERPGHVYGQSEHGA